MAALGVVEMVDENMANAARVHAIESGKTYAGRTLIAFGGGGPVHACRVAEKVGIDRVLVPIGAGVGSAIGFLRAPVGYEVVRSLYQRLGRFDVGRGQRAAGRHGRPRPKPSVAHGSFGAPTAADPARLHALCRPGPRDPGRPAGRTPWRGPTSPRCARRSTRNMRASTTARCRARTSR